MTEDELLLLLQSSEGKCEICGKPPIRWLVVDHCHTTNRVRGILCEKCNQALGLFHDNIDVIRAAANYLEA